MRQQEAATGTTGRGGKEPWGTGYARGWKAFELAELRAARRALGDIRRAERPDAAAGRATPACSPQEKIPLRRLCAVLPEIPVVLEVGADAVIERWYADQVRRTGRVRLYRGTREFRRVPRWRWPPLPGHPTYGWRAQWLALRLGKLCRRQRIRLRWHDWLELWQVGLGNIAFSQSLLRRVEAQMLRSQTKWAARHKPRFGLRVEPGGVGLVRR